MVWDARRVDAAGCWRPVDFEAVTESHLDLERFERDFADYPDQEMVGFVVDGAQFRAELSLGGVLVAKGHGMDKKLAKRDELRRNSAFKPLCDDAPETRSRNGLICGQHRDTRRGLITINT